MTSVYGRLSMRRCPLEPSTPGRMGHTTTTFYTSPGPCKWCRICRDFEVDTMPTELCCSKSLDHPHTTQPSSTQWILKLLKDNLTNLFYYSTLFYSRILALLSFLILCPAVICCDHNFEKIG